MQDLYAVYSYPGQSVYLMIEQISELEQYNLLLSTCVLNTRKYDFHQSNSIFSNCQHILLEKNVSTQFNVFVLTTCKSQFFKGSKRI